MDEGFFALVYECCRLAKTIPWRPDDPKERDWDEYKYGIMRNAAMGLRTCEFKYDPVLEVEAAKAGFCVVTRPADEQRKLCKALIVSW